MGEICSVLFFYHFKKELKNIVKDKVVLIIDDVITTGATTSEISKVLVKAGAKECYVLSFAHTKLTQLQCEELGSVDVKD